MGVDVEWQEFFHDNLRYTDIIKGIGCEGVQLVKDTDLQEADSKEKKKHRDLLRRVAMGVNFAIIGVENQEKVDYKIYVVDIHRFKDTSVFQRDVRHVFDFIHYSKDKEKLAELVESNSYYQHMEDDAYNVVTKYTNSKELISKEEYMEDAGRHNVCKAI